LTFYGKCDIIFIENEKGTKTMNITTNLTELNRRYNLGLSEEFTEDKDESYRGYNCMGFALGTYDWDEIDVYGYGEEYIGDDEDGCGEYEDCEPDMGILDEAVDEVLDYSDRIATYCNYRDEEIEEISIIYPHIRFLGYLSDHSENYYNKQLEGSEYLMAMRLASDDFHFARKMKDGVWYHKPGCYEIEAMQNEDLSDIDNWRGRYYGDIAMFAVTPTKEAV
jgi:hypothetical protein